MSWTAHYKFLCRWLDVLCDRADNGPPSAPADFTCPTAQRNDSSTIPSNSPRSPVAYAAESSTKKSIYVMTGDSATDRIETTAIHTVTELVLYENVPSAGLDTLWVIGTNAGNTVTQHQTMVFDEDGYLLSSSTKSTIPHCIIPAAAHRPGDDVTYVFDTDQHEIRTYEDTDFDGVPDTWGPVYASATSYPFLFESGDLAIVEATGAIRFSEESIFGSISRLNTELHELMDTNNDYVADASTTFFHKDDTGYGPVLNEQPEPGDTTVSGLGAVGHTIELWESNSAGDLIQLIDTDAVNYADNSVSFTVGAPLGLGDYVKLRDPASNAESTPVEVRIFGSTALCVGRTFAISCPAAPKRARTAGKEMMFVRTGCHNLEVPTGLMFLCWLRNRQINRGAPCAPPRYCIG